MENATPVLPKTPVINPKNEKISLNSNETMLLPLMLPKIESESESSSRVTTPSVPVTAAEIAAQSSAALDTTIKATTSTSPLPSYPSSPTTSIPNTATGSSAAFEIAQKKHPDTEEAEKRAWIARYTEAQPCRRLLKTTDPEYLEILRLWTVKQRRSGIERKKEIDCIVASAKNEEKGGKKKQRKEKWWHF